MRTPGHVAATPSGFTLVEMMVVVVMAAILMALALPGFQGLIQRYRVERMASALAAGLSFARTEAARRGRTVTLRRRSGCSGRDWSCGWDTVAGAGDAVETLRRQDPDGGVVVTKSADGAVSFSAMGHAATFAGFRFKPAGSTDESVAGNVVLCMSLGGRVTLRKEAGACS